MRNVLLFTGKTDLPTMVDHTCGKFLIDNPIDIGRLTKERGDLSIQDMEDLRRYSDASLTVDYHHRGCRLVGTARNDHLDIYKYNGLGRCTWLFTVHKTCVPLFITTRLMKYEEVYNDD